MLFINDLWPDKLSSSGPDRRLHARPVMGLSPEDHQQNLQNMNKCIAYTTADFVYMSTNKILQKSCNNIKYFDK